MRPRARFITPLLLAALGAAACSSDRIPDELVPTSDPSIHDTTTTPATSLDEGVSGTIFEPPPAR